MDTILCIWDRMGDYHRARIQALRTINPNVITADLGSLDKLYEWKSEEVESHFLLSNKKVDEFDLFKRIKKFRKILKEENVNTVAIAGYGRLDYLLMMLWSRIKGKRVILFVESWYSRGLLVDRFKGIMIGRFAHAYFASGKRARQHLINNLKINPIKIREGYSTVDNQHFSNPLPDYTINTLLCVARFSPEKNLLLLVEIFLKSKLSKTWNLNIIGGGPQEHELRTLSSESNNINIINWQDYQNLPERYHNASAFVLPSLFEPWGLVVNEAMAAGLPIINSEQCGCMPDLVDEKNGITFNAEEQDSMLQAFNQWSQLTEHDLGSMGKVSLSRIASFSTESWASTLQNLVNED